MLTALAMHGSEQSRVIAQAREPMALLAKYFESSSHDARAPGPEVMTAIPGFERQ